MGSLQGYRISCVEGLQAYTRDFLGRFVMNVFRHITAFEAWRPDVMTISNNIFTIRTNICATINVALMNMSDGEIRWTRNLIHIFPVRGEATLRSSIVQESATYHSWIKL